MRALSTMRRLTLIPQGITIVVSAFLPIFAIVTMLPAVPSLIDHFGSDPAAHWKVPMMVAAPGLTIALTAPFAGWLVDILGRRNLLIAATFLYGIIGTLPFFVESLDFLFASRFALGLCEAAILTIVNTLLGDYWDDSGRRDWLFIQGLVGPFLASGVILLAGPVTALRWNGIFLVYAVAFPIALAMLLFLFEPTAAQREAVPTGEPSVKQGFPWGWIMLTGSVTLLTATLYYVFSINGGLAFREVGVTNPAHLSELIVIPSLFVMLGALVFRLLGGTANAVQLAAFFIILGLGLVGIGLAPDYRWMVAAVIVQQIGTGMTVPSLIAWTQTRLPVQHRGRGMGVWTACFFLGQFVSPWLVHRFGLLTGSIQGAFLMMGLIGLVSGLVAAASLVRRSRLVHASAGKEAAPRASGANT